MENFESVLQDFYTSSVNFKIGLLQYNACFYGFLWVNVVIL